MAHPEHALHRLSRPLDLRDLTQHRQLVVRDSALHQPMDSGWLKAEQRWTLSHLNSSIGMLERGLGFAWLPEAHICTALAQGRLKPLLLGADGVREVPLQLIHRDRDRAGPATHAMANALLAAVADADQIFEKTE